MRPVRRFVRALRRGFREFRRTRPPLRATLYRVILIALLVPVFFIGWLNARNEAVERQYESAPARSLDQAQFSWVIRAEENDLEKMKDIASRSIGWKSGPSGSGGWEGDYGPGIPARYGVPTVAEKELLERGYSYGATELEGYSGRYVVWMTGPERGEWVVATPAPLRWRAVEWLLGVILILAVLTLIASPAAWYLERRIARPVAEVAQASRVMASGAYPKPLPVKGPAELVVLAESFNTMANRLKRAERAEREFLLSVGHELKTPLTAIDGYAELLSDGAVSAETAGPVLVAETARLRRLVADLLDLAHMHQSSFAVQEGVVDLGTVVTTVVERYSNQADELGVHLKAHFDHADEVNGDEDRVVQVLSNLVENAFRYTPRDGTVTLTADGPSVIVEDTGPGIATEDLPCAFERFYLHDRYRSKRQVGTGLGLAIVHELVERMGGEVTVWSAPGAGTRFTLTLRPLTVDAPGSA